MMLDFRTYDATSPMEYDLCIVGAGAAGIIIARCFADTRFRVALVESGGLRLERGTQALYKGEIVGLAYFNLAMTRLRCFGGSTGHWAGMCTPLLGIDFEHRPWVPHSGWPITREHLDSYYAAAHKILELGDYNYDPLAIQPEGAAYLPFSPKHLRVRLWRVAPILRFAEEFGPELDQAQNISVILYANATEILANETATHVHAVKLATLDGKTALLNAKTLVLACGGLEIPRLLLNSNRVQTTGLGNQHDLVGRFFMEHPHFASAIGVPSDGTAWLRAYQSFTRNGIEFNPAIGPSEEVQRKEGILNATVGLMPTREPHLSEGYLALKRLLRFAVTRTRRFGKQKGVGASTALRLAELRHIARHVVAHRREVMSGVYGRLFGPRRILFFSKAEQAPNPESRVFLSEERDSLGLRRIKLDWRLTELDKRTIKRTTELIGQEMERLGLGHVNMNEWLTADNARWPPTLEGGHHHMGTTRMASDPERGVVDRHCRVHRIDNLYIAGCSVFPTGGYANPMLTIIAMALRLAEHLKTRLV